MTEGIRAACALLTWGVFYVINSVLLLELKIHAYLQADTVFSDLTVWVLVFRVWSCFTRALYHCVCCLRLFYKPICPSSFTTFEKLGLSRKYFFLTCYKCCRSTILRTLICSGNLKYVGNYSKVQTSMCHFFLKISWSPLSSLHYMCFVHFFCMFC